MLWKSSQILGVPYPPPPTNLQQALVVLAFHRRQSSSYRAFTYKHIIMRKL